jgi:regulatory protein
MKPFKNSQYGNREIKPAKNPEDVLNYGLWHLGRRDHSIHELREKLGRKTDNPDWIELTINKLVDMKYLDDERFVENFLKYCNETKHYGPMRIKQELKLKGIDNELIKNSFEENEFDYFEAALEYLNKKYPNPIEERKEKDRITRFLINKGFGFDMIRYAFEEHLNEPQ